MSETLRMPTDDELVVNEKIFGRCNHNFWTEFQDRDGRQMLGCSDCGDEIMYRDSEDFGFGSEVPPAATPREAWLRGIRHYSTDPLMAALVVRVVEAGGWRPFVFERAGDVNCSFERGGKKFSSGQHPTKAAAVVEAAAMLGRSGRFTVPVSFFSGL